MIPLPEPRFHSVDEIRLLHSLAVLEFGGDPGLRSAELLDSAVAQPRAMFEGRYLHAHPFEMCAAYGYHLCQNHPFVDGNKRIAWAAMRAFCHREGFHLRVQAEEAVRQMLAVATGQVQKDELARWIARHAQPRPQLELRDFFARIEPESLISTLTAIADSDRSGGAGELSAIVDEASHAIPVIAHLSMLYQMDRQNNEQAIHFIQLLAAIHRIAEEAGYEW